MTNAFFTKPSELAPSTKARSVDINTLSTAVDTAFDKMPSEELLKQGAINFAADTSTVDNTYLIALPYSPAAYADGLKVTMRPARTNTGAATLNVNNLGAKPILRNEGIAAKSGDIITNGPLTLIYSAAANAFYMPPSAMSQAAAAAMSATAAAGSAAAASGSATAADDSAGTAAARAGAAALSATAASGSATAAALSAASIAGGPVASIDGKTGIVTLKTINGIALTGAGDIVLSTAAVRTPSNVTPANAAENISASPTLTGSPYYSLYGVAMAAAQFQASTSADFSTLVVNTGDIAGTAIAYAASALARGTAYYWRTRHKDAEGVYSAWSVGTSFTTSAQDYIQTPTATPASFGDPLEGGFYAGMIWNELAQTATSTLIGTGSKTFTVADMTSAPIAYAGQTLEVRSRANPVNKMIGVVTGALGTSLTVNITSIGGSGTFTDWSIMARYRVIVAPKSSGENAAIAYKNANTAAPTACGTLSEGYKATMAMVAADTSTVYPAAWFCKSLTIAGRADWYLPARDELELVWRNLKPTTDANYVTADRSSGTPNYMNLGSYGDTAATHGLDNNSSPSGAAHTSGVPAQVVAGKNFRTGEAEAFVYGSAYYWSASEYSATSAWFQHWASSNPGFQNGNGKTSTFVARAVRRSII